MHIGRGDSKVYIDMPEEGLLDYDTAILYADKKDKLGYYRLKERLFLSPKMKVYYYDEQILAIYNEAIAAFPDSPKAYLDRAFFYFLKDKNTEALADAKKSMKICHTIAGYGRVGFLMGMSQEYSEKKITDVYDKCIREFPNEAESYINRGDYFDMKYHSLSSKLPVGVKTKEMLDCNDKSIADFKKAIEINPNEANYYQDLINIKMESNKYGNEEILKDFKTREEHCRDDKFIYFFRGNYYASIKRWNEAISDMDTAIYLSNNNPDLYVNRANYKDQSSNYKPEEILKDLNKAVALKAETNLWYDAEIYKRLRAKYGK